MTEFKELGQAAFEKWASLLPSSQPFPMTWDQLPVPSQQGWQQVAEEVIRQNGRNRDAELG